MKAIVFHDVGDIRLDDVEEPKRRSSWRATRKVATFSPNTRYLDRFEEAQDEAREARRGIWSLSDGELGRLRDRGNGIGGGCG